MSNLRELYHSFKNSHPEVKVGFSKFAEMRPGHCVLAGASGTHSICVCTIHQNVKLMFQSARLGELATSDGLTLGTYQHCLAQVICNPAMPSCFLGECKLCPGFGNLQQLLHRLLDDNMIDNVTIKQWVSVDRSTLVALSKPADEFVEYMCEKLQLLLPHSFIATQQSLFFSERKSKLA